MRTLEEIKKLINTWKESGKAEGFYCGDLKVQRRKVYVDFSVNTRFERAFVFVRSKGFPNWEEILAIRNAIWTEQEVVYFRYNAMSALCNSFMTMELTHNVGDEYGKAGSPCFSPLQVMNVQICCDNGLPFITYEESDEINKELDMVKNYTGLELDAIKNLRRIREHDFKMSGNSKDSHSSDVNWLLENHNLENIAKHIRRLLTLGK